MRFTLSLSPVAIRLTGLAGVVFALSLAGMGEAVAGPTVKKRTWYTLQGTAVVSRVASWAPAAGGDVIRAPNCPAGETFLVTDVDVTPAGGRYVNDRSVRLTAGLEELGPWSAHLQTDLGPGRTVVRGRGGAGVASSFPGGLPVPRGLGQYSVELYADWPTPAFGAPVLMAVEYRITLTGACGLALGEP